MLGEQAHQEVVGGDVAGVLELLALQALLADLEQAGSGDGGEPGGEDVVVGGGLGGRGAGIEGHRVTLATAGQELKRCWVRSRPSVTSVSTASAAWSTWNGSSLRSTVE